MFKDVAAMRAADNFFPFYRALFFGALVMVIPSCNRMATPPAKQLLKDADARATSGDFLQAINLYETALDGSDRSADIHFKMALLYDDKMGDPLNALHHFKRYLTLAPTGPHAEEVKNSMKRDELALLTTLSGDSMVSRAEAGRLKNENLTLRKEVDDLRAANRSAATNEKTAARSNRAKTGAHSKKRTTKRDTQAH
jgi:hypothetical protein